VEEVICTPARLYVRHTLPLEQAKVALSSRNSTAAGASIARARAHERGGPFPASCRSPDPANPGHQQPPTDNQNPVPNCNTHSSSYPLLPTGLCNPVVVDDNFNPMGLVYLEDIEGLLEEEAVKAELLNQARLTGPDGG
jgi:hypothetical protein